MYIAILSLSGSEIFFYIISLRVIRVLTKLPHINSNLNFSTLFHLLILIKEMKGKCKIMFGLFVNLYIFMPN